MPDILSSVGKGGVNTQRDVDIVRPLLGRHRRWLGAYANISANGAYDETLGNAIAEFQKTACSVLRPDGRADPGGLTMRRLQLPRISGPQHAVFNKVCWARSGSLTEANLIAAANALGCELAAIKAVTEVEVSSRGPWEEFTGLPIILFERHYFRDLTGGVYNRSHPDISGPYGGHGRYSQQHPKLQRAAMLNEEAALKSASWGAFQIMGRYHSLAGYPTVAGFVTGMNSSVQKHLEAFVSYINGTPAAKTALQNKNWAAFARAYNGPNYRDNDYDGKMSRAYQRITAASNAGN